MNELLQKMMSRESVKVTSPLLPPLDDFIESLRNIWDCKWITNNGQYHRQLEQALAEYLKVPYISLFTNGVVHLRYGNGGHPWLCEEVLQRDGGSPFRILNENVMRDYEHDTLKD